MATKFPPAAKKPQFIAYSRHGEYSYKGTLDEIMSEMDDAEVDPEDYQFFRADEEVKVKYVKKLTLEVEDGNS